MSPRRFGRYAILDCLGRGGMGVVYRAHDPVLQRDVAIKVLSGHLLIDPDARARFHREGRALAALSHPGIVTILDVGEQDETPYLVTEFLRGSDLARRMREGSPLSLGQKLDIIAKLCESLAAAHEVGIVHCDIKPANIWLLPNDAIKVLDFGIARGAAGRQTGSSGLGSPHYMAPEQLSGGEFDRRTDIFALGVVMYELFAGCRPFVGDTPTAVMFQVLTVDPPDLATLNPDLPDFIIQAVARALQKAPAHRFQSVQELREAVDVSGDLETLAANGRPGSLMYMEPELRSEDLAVPRPVRLAPVSAGLVLALAASLGVYYAAPSDPGGEHAALASPPVGNIVVPNDSPRAQPDSAGRTFSLRVETSPPGATFSIDEGPEEFVTPTVVTLPLDAGGLFRFRRSGHQVVERTVTAEQREKGLLQVTLAPVRMIAVRAEGDYDFEVLVGDRLVSAAATRHDIMAQAGAVVTFRSSRYLLEESVRAEGPALVYHAPPLGGVRLFVAGSLMRCEARLVSEQGSRRRAVERHLGHPPFQEMLQIVPGRYELSFACPHPGTAIVRRLVITGGQVDTLRVVAGSQ